METPKGRGACRGEGRPSISYVHLGDGTTPTSSIGVAVEPGGGVAMGLGGGCGVAGWKEPVLSVPLAGAFASSCAAQVLDAVEDEVGVGCPKDSAEVPASKPKQGRLAVLHRGRAHALDQPFGPVLGEDP